MRLLVSWLEGGLIWEGLRKIEKKIVLGVKMVEMVGFVWKVSEKGGF